MANIESKTKKKWAVGCCIVFVLALAAVFLILPGQVRNYLLGPEGKYFDSAGVQIHYTDQGVGEPVILIHGYTANSNLNWRVPGILPKLQRHFRVITMDVRGHGRSDKPHDASRYGIEMANDVGRLMDHLKIPKAHLVGYSMGGFITMKFMVMHPERLISAMPCGAAWMTPSDPLCNLLNGIHARLTRKGMAFSSIGAMTASLQRKVQGSMVDLEALGCVAKRFKELAVTGAELRTVTIPVMAVKGGQDGTVSAGSDLKAALPGFQGTVIPGGRHNTVIFSSEFQAAIVNFLLAHSSEKQ